MEEIQVDYKWKWLEEKEFPCLPELKCTEVKALMVQLSSNKALAFDGLSNTLFSASKEKDKVNSCCYDSENEKEMSFCSRKEKEENESDLEKTAKIMTNL